MQIKFDKILGCLRELDEGTGGGGTSGDTIITGTVATYAELPLAAGYTGKYYIVDTATGTWILGTLKKSGLYKSNGTTWVYIDNVPETTSLSDGTTVITGTNIILEGTNGVVTTTDVNNNKITISGPNIPDQLSDLSDDSTHRLVTDTEKTTWNNKLDSYTETDPVFLASQANNITSTHITTLNNTSGTNTGDQTASTTSVNATVFNKNLSSADDTVQKALATLDQLEASGGSSSASDVSTITTNFNNNLSSADNTVQKALDTLDNFAISSTDVTDAIATTGLSVDYIKRGTEVTVGQGPRFTCATGVWTKVPMTATITNTGEWNATIERFTASKTGKYMLMIEFQCEKDNVKGVGWYMNGSWNRQYQNPGLSFYFNTLINFQAGDYLEFYYFSTTNDPAWYVVKIYQLFSE